MKNKLLIFALSIIFIASSCDNKSQKTGKDKNIATENFDNFYKTFYSDTSFQLERIIIPLEGKILDWHLVKDSIIESKWNNIDLEFISDLKTKQPLIKNSIWSIDSTSESKIEKLYVENSGFFIEREFKTKNGKWYLIRIDISNL